LGVPQLSRKADWFGGCFLRDVSQTRAEDGCPLLSRELDDAADGHRRYRVPLGPLSRSARCRDHQSVGKRRASLLLGANGSESLGAEPIIVTNWVEELEARVK
jgi:hypothetical protein